jgi:hypothetical protein
MPDPAPQGILDPSQPDAYVPNDQAQFDEMKTALAEAPNAAQKFAALCAFLDQGYDKHDGMAAGTLAGLAGATAFPAVPYPVDSQVGAKLGAPWKQAVGDAYTARDPSSNVVHSGTARPVTPGGLADKLGLKR